MLLHHRYNSYIATPVPSIYQLSMVRYVHHLAFDEWVLNLAKTETFSKRIFSCFPIVSVLYILKQADSGSRYYYYTYNNIKFVKMRSYKKKCFHSYRCLAHVQVQLYPPQLIPYIYLQYIASYEMLLISTWNHQAPDVV